MKDYSLRTPELAELRALHRVTRDKRAADPIRAVILLGSGWSAEDVAEEVALVWYTSSRSGNSARSASNGGHSPVKAIASASAG